MIRDILNGMNESYAEGIARGAAEERARCLRVAQYAREKDETDMLQVLDWFESGFDPAKEGDA